MSRMYNDPAGGTPSQIGPQMNDFYYQKMALIEAKKEQYFLPLADVTAMPKHFGKKIKRYHYLPLLADANINDQGIDAAGVAIDSALWDVTLPAGPVSYDVESEADDAVASVNAVEAAVASKSGTGPWSVSFTKTSLNPTTDALSAAVVADVPGSYRVQRSGNLYGSSKDIGTIPGKLPVLSETGGRVNRVGFTRKEIEGTIQKLGFFDEYTQESMDFDSDAELMMHINREMVYGASEITEDMLQIDLINNAGVVKYTGAATDISEVDATDLTYRDLLRLSIDLDNNRTPKHTKVITGTRLVDTKTLPAARVMYIGSELQPLIEEMKDLHNERAFIPVQHYTSAGTVLNGEIGTIGYFRVVVVPEMLKWAGAGADATGDELRYKTGEKYDVFPMLVVGDGSFTTIGFQTDGKTVKFKITHKKPGEETADRNDPYGETGFMSIKWYYGFMLLRGERLAVQYTTAKL